MATLSGARGGRGAGHTFLGISPSGGRQIGVSLEARQRHVYVPGVTGVGKTTFILGLIAQDLRDGRGLYLFDPAGDAVTDVIERVNGFGRAQDVLLLDLQARDVAPGINLFACSDPSDPQATAATAELVMAAFKKNWGDSWGPRMQDLLGNATFTLIANPGTTLVDLPRLLTDEPFRRRLVARVTNEVVVEFWRREYDPLSIGARQQIYAPLTNKVREFLRNPFLRQIVAQPQNVVDPRAAIAANKIVLVRLDPQMEEATNLLGSILLLQLLAAAFARRDLVKAARHPFMVYVDEAHRFATPTFVTLLREARKYGLALTAATPMHTLLPPDVATAFTNVGTVVAFQLVPQDARALAPLFTGVGLPRTRVLDPDPLGRLLRSGHPDRALVGLAKRLERATAWTGMRDVRLAIEHHLYEAMGGGGEAAWERLAATIHLSDSLKPLVRELGVRLARDPMLSEQTVDVAKALTRLPAHHALIRYKEGVQLREAFVRTLPTRPVGPVGCIAPLGIPRTKLAQPADEPGVIANDDGADDEGGERPAAPAPARGSRRRIVIPEDGGDAP